MRTAFVESVAVIGPGLLDWSEGSSALADTSTYVKDKMPLDVAVSLTPNERRRTTPTIRLALQVVDQLAHRSSLDLSKAKSVFSSSLGDLQVIDAICFALTLPGQSISPVLFHNIVHNTPAGYWSIGAKAARSSTTITAGSASFAAGLVEALVCVQDAEEPVLFVCYEYPGPAVIDQHLPSCAPFAVAMALTAEPMDGYCCALQSEIVAPQPDSRIEHEALEALRTGNTAARALPLLQAIATGMDHRVLLANSGGSSLAVDVIPASTPTRVTVS